MKKICWLFMALCGINLVSLHAVEDPEATAALRNALGFMETLQRQGGWAMAWSSDYQLTMGEHAPKPHNTITVQYPATPGIAGVYLRASRLLEDDGFLDVAIKAGEALIAGQIESGGFPHEFTAGTKSSRGTFDDDTTQSATRFLVALWKETQDERFARAAKRCAQFMLDSQYENGGWPQGYPLRDDHYSNYITLNDDAMMDVIRALFLCYHTFDDERYYDAAVRGADCLLALQAKEPQGGWAQQYTVDGKPAPARLFEPMALSSSESVRALRVLVEVYRETGDKKYLKSGELAFAWLRRSKLPNGKWARFYEIGTNHDLYSTADGEIMRDVNRARPGYSWQGNYFSESLERLYTQLLAAPVEDREPFFKDSKPDKRRLQERAQRAVERLDAQGRWVDGMSSSNRANYEKTVGDAGDVGMIHSGTFCANANAILDYLEFD